MAGFHWEIIIVAILGFAPVIIGFAWVWPDANRLGQPGWLWAVLTILLGWLALIAYVVVRGISISRRT